MLSRNHDLQRGKKVVSAKVVYSTVLFRYKLKTPVSPYTY